MWYIHVNQHKIRKNINSEEIDPPIAIRKRSGPVRYANSVKVPEGSVLIYDPNNRILSCGARLVLQCPSEPEILE